MPAFQLSPIETRVLGCLIEKERLTPENYPLSLHSLTAACNQATNREPVSGYDEAAVEEGVNALREKKLATVIFGAGSRVQKYRHKLLEHYTLDPREVALICVLLLRGPQTPGELRIRTERMFAFRTLEDVQARLDELARGDVPLVQMQPARPGQKERRYLQLLSAEQPMGEVEEFPAPPRAASPSRIEELSAEVTALRSDLAALRDEFASFKKQFE
jgi:uncharacterized protein YceH (UPF0502 family)